jgi:hypothetical protein
MKPNTILWKIIFRKSGLNQYFFSRLYPLKIHLTKDEFVKEHKEIKTKLCFYDFVCQDYRIELQ